MNQSKSGTLMLGTLNPGNLEPHNPGNLELELWKSQNLLLYLGTLPNFGTLPDDIAALEPCLLLGCKGGLMLQHAWLARSTQKR